MSLNVTSQTLDQAPDCSLIPARTLAQWLGVSQATIWRWVRSGRLPSPQKLGENTTRFQVGAVRAALAKMAA
jgi:excisionase family DNA binding protein